jgi:hypothetical protein
MNRLRESQHDMRSMIQPIVSLNARCERIKRDGDPTFDSEELVAPILCYRMLTFELDEQTAARKQELSEIYGHLKSSIRVA